MRFLICCLCLLPAALRAEVPRVATDIAPVHSIVAKVMQGVGTPDLVIPPGASPHSYALRPSEARALSGADLVVWVGPGLTPWLVAPIETLAGQAVHFALLEQAGTPLLEMREGVAFVEDGHDHGDDPDAAHDAGHGDDHDADHGHDHKGKHDGHDHDADHGHDHDPVHDDHDTAHDAQGHGVDHAADPHAWLDPARGAVWAAAVAEQLAQMDPAHAQAYRANAAALQADVDVFDAKWAPQFDRLKEAGFIVFHDAFQYFEAFSGLTANSAVQVSDAAQPGAARIAALRALLADRNIACAFTEPQLDPKMVTTVTEGLAVKTGELDPLGRDVPLGPDHYLATLDALAASMVGCLSS